MMLSVLICTLPERSRQLRRLVSELTVQAGSLPVEILTNLDNRLLTTGAKRNELMKGAKGRYTVFIDDDDEIPSYYIEEIMRALQYEPDCVGFGGYMTTDNGIREQFRISKDLPYQNVPLGKGEHLYLRFTNHLSPVRREIALQFPFPNKTWAEDYEWAKQLHQSGLLKREVTIDKPMYYYNYKRTKHKDMYSQNNEEEIILNYFGESTGTLLDIGANDGITLSNSYALIQKGWKAVLVEPSPAAFNRLRYLYEGNSDVKCLNVAIGNQNSVQMKMFESANHLGLQDVGLLSTTIEAERDRWKGTAFREIRVQMLTIETLLEMSMSSYFDFINIDAEGLDMEILRQINLTSIGCRCLCIEHNSVPQRIKEITEQVLSFGPYRVIGRNAENLIFAI